MRRCGGLLVVGGVLLFPVGSTFGQAVVEYSTATAAGTTGAAANSQGISKSIGGIFGNLNKTADNAKKSDTARTSSGPSRIIKPSLSSGSAAEKDAEPEAGRRKLLRPEEIRRGMLRSELVEKCGGPFMKTSKVEGVELVEIYYYQGADDIIVVTVREGAVTSISPPPARAKPAESASAK